MNLREEMRTRRALVIIRAEQVTEPKELASTLVGAGLPMIEFSLTTGGALEAIRAASTVDGCLLGAGTVLTEDQAREVIDAGAAYLVTPGVNEPVAKVAAELGVPVMLGAFTPTEIYRAHELGSAVVKVFPAHRLGPGYFADLRSGPYPNIPLVASGGVSSANAAEYLHSGAIAVTAGSNVVPRDMLADCDFEGIAGRAEEFAATVADAHTKTRHFWA